jgi:D-alanyl-D-alanine dipeptidase
MKVRYGMPIKNSKLLPLVALCAVCLAAVALPPRPAPANPEWMGLIGEYGPGTGILYILERSGKLTTFSDGHEYAPLDSISPDRFRNTRGEDIVFVRGSNGIATQVRIGTRALERRPIGPAEGQVFRITPLRPVSLLREEALRDQPPTETGPFRPSDLIDVTTLDPTLKLEIRYATSNNFLGTPLYTEARAFMQRPAAEALVRVERQLRPLGYGLLIHDAYRPWYVTKIFWEATPPDKHMFVADPAQGSRHNRGCAVDLTLYELKTGKAVTAVSGYDEFSPRAYPYYPGGTSLQRWYRDLLRTSMVSQGFTVYDTEWWHFDYQDWRLYPIGNQTFEQLSR